jgi:hypothetical protein
MTHVPVQMRPAPLSAPVRRIMRKHGLPEPYARLVVFLVYREGCE